MEEVSWYQMMGFSKILLRNFVIGCVMILITTVVTLAILLDKSYEKNATLQSIHKEELVRVMQEGNLINEKKNDALINVLTAALKHQNEIDTKIANLKRTPRTK